MKTAKYYLLLLEFYSETWEIYRLYSDMIQSLNLAFSFYFTVIQFDGFDKVVSLPVCFFIFSLALIFNCFLLLTIFTILLRNTLEN